MMSGVCRSFTVAALLLAGCTTHSTSEPAAEAIPDEAAVLARLVAQGVGNEAPGLLFLGTAERRVAFAHIEDLLPTRPLESGAAPYPLVSAPADLSGETGGCCISATLRDYARLGLFALNDGVLPDGTRVLPEGWMAASISPSKGAPFYGYLWWLDGDGRYIARGIFGQQIYIDPIDNIVIAAHGNAPAAVGTEYHEHLNAAIRAIAAAIRG